jgi:hypothetical protein
MATIDSLLAQIQNATVRSTLSAEIAEMRKRFEWGLVFGRLGSSREAQEPG